MTPRTDWYNQPLEAYTGGFNHNIPEGSEVGIEIEVEGVNLPRGNITGWVIHEDGSLRGESAEYVFRTAEHRDTVPKRLAALQKAFADSNSIINQSYRTSVHVHTNVRNWPIKNIYNNIMMYIIFEDVMAELAGKDRIGNLFCLRAKEAEFFMEALRGAIVQDNLANLNTENLRYSAVNPMALFGHGSLEFRAFRGTTDMDAIQAWVNMILAIRDASRRYENPIQIVQNISTMGPDAFASDIFTQDQIGTFPAGWQPKVFEGAQLVQHAAYGHEWIPTEQREDLKNKRAAKTNTTTLDPLLEFRLRLDERVPAPPPRWIVAQDPIVDDLAHDDDDIDFGEDEDI